MRVLQGVLRDLSKGPPSGPSIPPAQQRHQEDARGARDFDHAAPATNVPSAHIAQGLVAAAPFHILPHGGSDQSALQSMLMVTQHAQGVHGLTDRPSAGEPRPSGSEYILQQTMAQEQSHANERSSGALGAASASVSQDSRSIVPARNEEELVHGVQREQHHHEHQEMRTAEAQLALSSHGGDSHSQPTQGQLHAVGQSWQDMGSALPVQRV